MRKIEINLLSLEHIPREFADQHTEHKILFPQTVVGVLAVLGVLLFGTSVFSYQQSRDMNSGLNRTVDGVFGALAPLNTFSESGTKLLSGEREDRINILLLGIGGKNHDGSHLTDTVIIASIKPTTRQVALISIPRDLVVPINGSGWRKINTINAFGETERPGYGAELTRQTMSTLFAIPLHYVLRVDFDGFVKVVDLLGGIRLTVDQPFTDYSYPTLNYKYQTVSFRAGEQIMDGETALKFVRSRHSIMNNEGSDFARSKRQQKVMIALKEKILSHETLLNPSRVASLLSTLEEHITTDLKPWEMVRLSFMARKIDRSSIIHLGFDNSPSGLLVDDVIEGAYILKSRDDTFSEIHTAISTVFETHLQNNKESARVIVQNGTRIEGLASREARQLEASGYQIDAISNANERTLAVTQIFDLSHAKPEAKKILETKFYTLAQDGVARAERTLFPAADFLIIVGSSADLSTPQAASAQ